MAQESKVNGWVSYIEIGPSFLQHEGVNAALDSQGFGGISKTYFSLGAGFDAYRNRWIIGGKLYGFMVDTSYVAGQEASLQYQFFNLRLGYSLAKPGLATRLYPTVGFGWGAALLRVRPISSPISEKHWTAGALMDVALNLQHHTPFIDTDDNYGVSMGFSIGYMHDFSQGWETADFVPDEVVTYSPKGFYVRVSLGVGVRSKLVD